MYEKMKEYQRFFPFFFPFVAFFLGNGLIIKPTSGVGYFLVSALNSNFSGKTTAFYITATL
jgi:hypothetical protein